MNLSKWHFYSYGMVAMNKPLDTNTIEVWAAEITPMVDGEVADNVEEYQAKGVDALGKSFNVKADTTKTIEAKWLPFGESNRLTSPDVRRGEPVMIWQFADDNESFFWTTVSNIDLRRLETVIFAISASPKEDEKPTSENTYYIEASSHKGAITIHTSQANGEPFAFDVQINAKDGNVVIKDNIGNYISMDSKENHLEMTNADTSTVSVNKKEILIFAPDKITMKSKDIDILASNHTNVHSEKSMDTKTGNMTTTNDTWDIKSETTHTGNLTENGMFALNGNMTTAGGNGGSGKVSIGADVEITEGLKAGQGGEFGGEVKVKKLTSSDPISAPNV